MRRRFEQSQRRRAGPRQLQRREIKKRSLAGQHGAPVGHQIGRLEQDLRRPNRHDARQGPARDRHRPLDRSGRKQDPPRRDGVAHPVGRERERAVGVNVPHRRRRAVLGAAGAQRGRERLTHQIIHTKG